MYLDLNSKQSAILEFIKYQVALRGYPPSVREICIAVGLKSTSTVHFHMNKLEKLGYIKRNPTKPRAIEILDSNIQEINNQGFNQKILSLPKVGSIVSSNNLLISENIEEYIYFPANLIKGSDSFVLKANGDSMINAGILDGDHVVVDRTNIASNSQIVVALIHKEYATVKRFFREDDLIRLQPENELIEPIILNSKDVEIVGVVTGVFRVI